MKRSVTAVSLALTLGLLAAPVMAQPANHKVTLTVPVDISAMPYIKSFIVGCLLTYPAGTTVTQDMSAAANNRYDGTLTNGEFHGKVTVVVTALDGPAPTGYDCGLSLVPADGSGGFTPMAATQTGVPPEHLAAAGTTPVTDARGTFPSAQATVTRAVPKKK